MLLLKCQCLFPVFSPVSIILFPIFPGYVFFGFFGSFLPAFLSAKSFAFCLTANIAEKAAVWNADEHSICSCFRETEKKMCSGLTEKELEALDAGICRMLENLTEA